MMRAGRMVGRGRMACEEVPEPGPPADGEVLVRTTHASICGSDLHVVCMGVGAPPPPGPPGFPGHEGVGVVVASGHPGFREGQRVLTVPNAIVGSCFAELQRLPAAYVIPLPDDDTPSEHLLMAQQLGTVIYALRQRPVDVCGATCAVIGQGSAGLLFTFLLKRAGATVIASDLSEARRTVAARMGADVVVDGGDLAEAVRDHTGGRGADYVVEAVGSAPTLSLAVDLARLDGTVLWFGLPDTEADVPFRFQAFFRKRLAASSTWGAQDEPGLVSFRHAVDIIHRGELDVTPLLSHMLDISEIDRAFELAHSRADDAVKVSVRF